MRFNTASLLFFDLEANGLTPDTIWCIHINDESYHGDRLKEAVDILANPNVTLVGHNIIGYDLPVLSRLYGLEYDVDRVYDTVIMSRLLQPDRGGHSLAVWGERVGIEKLPDLDWNVWDEGLLPRCAIDVEITKAVYYRLQREQTGHDWTQAAWIEHWIAHYHQRQESNGVAFHLENAVALADEIQERADTVITTLKSEMPWLHKANPKPTLYYIKDGSVSSHAKKWWGEDIDTVGGNYTKIVYSEPNPNSDKQLKAWLASIGWTPDEWNYKKDKSGKPLRPLQISGPKISKSSLLPLGERGDLVRQRGMLQHRLSLLRNREDPTKGLVNNIRGDGRVVAGGIPMGTPTGRYTHFGVVNIPRAKESSEYGKELRSLFVAEKGHELAGSDADGLEARMEAHYTWPYDDGEYAAELLDGDIHQKNADIWDVPRDPAAKAGKYLLTYGGQAPKLANALGLPPALGQEYFDMFWDGNDSLKRLKNAVEKALSKGWLKGLDGRKLYIRSKHSALNMLFQSAGSITVKLATIYMNQELDKQGFDWKQVVHMHDEFLLEFLEGQDHAMINTVIADCWRRAGQTLHLNVPITGDIQWGDSWAECH